MTIDVAAAAFVEVAIVVKKLEMVMTVPEVE